MRKLMLLMVTVVVIAGGCKKKEEEIKRSKTHMLLVLDAAHGGSDTGSRRADGSVLEKKLVLEMCRKMASTAPEYDIEVLLTRTEDREMSYDERSEIAEGVNADAFISVHINRGVPVRPYEVFMVPGGVREAESRALARTILTRLKKEGRDTLMTDRNVLTLAGSKHPAFALECGDITLPQDVAAMEREDELCRWLLESVVEWSYAR